MDVGAGYGLGERKGSKKQKGATEDKEERATSDSLR